MSLVEEAYFQAWGKVGGSGRVRRAFSLFVSIRKMLELQVKSQRPGISGGELTWRTAKRMYSADLAATRLLEGMDHTTVLADDFPETIERLVQILAKLGLRFHFTGGIAVSYYGDPRFTQDLDLVIDLALDQPETMMLLDRLSSGYTINKSVATDAIERHGLFQAIDEKSMIKIDFHVGEKIAGELGRSTLREIAPGFTAPLVSKEDAILSKLRWIQMGSGHKGRHDTKEMLRRDENLDRTCLKERAQSLGVQDLLEELEAEVRAGWSPS
jgi:hypothetical protein